ncbi:NAD(P)H-binding protein [Goodfellowiella coeruleoviolacea]|uniref:Uncharacterized conserved protein YbjT, contains NAD(P)-binding and DUF2867 domains n=1 Tax=Goodfellowiella coeruleoviolacea TaxID=334858 RepID=A0AAE3KE87_9PSEU|nr:NAD(P)H-binding protein [Goodfellowiella coeruleoviolacea]MCP2165051.1 Uncharacterized conserved protein YbjT, contains NAD(P)-binding and DUF2867 domains [Goodfellowiella coeruleoviolacea]
MTFLVTGARGQVGRHVLRGLVDAGLPVRAASRDATTLDLPAGVESVSVDLTAAETLDAALRGVTGVFLYTQRSGVEDFVTAARAAGVAHVVQLSSGFSAAPDADTNPIARLHLRVERALADSGLGHTVLRPGALAHNTLAWAESIRTRSAVALTHPDAHEAVIHPADIADVAVRVLATGAHQGETLTLTGPESLTARDQVAILADVLGRPITLTELTRDQALAQRPAAIPEPVLAVLLDTAASHVGVPAEITDVVGTITGHPARTFREWAVEHRAAFADPTASA